MPLMGSFLSGKYSTFLGIWSVISETIILIIQRFSLPHDLNSRFVSLYVQDENHWRTSRLCIYLEAHLNTLNYISNLKIMFPASIFIKMPPKFRWWVYTQNEKEQEAHLGHTLNGKPGIKRNDESLKAR